MNRSLFFGLFDLTNFFRNEVYGLTHDSWLVAFKQFEFPAKNGVEKEGTVLYILPGGGFLFLEKKWGGGQKEDVLTQNR